MANHHTNGQESADPACTGKSIPFDDITAANGLADIEFERVKAEFEVAEHKARARYGHIRFRFSLGFRLGNPLTWIRALLGF